MKIAVLPGDGIGTEIVAQAVRVLHVLDLKFELETALVGGAAYEAFGHPLPESTLQLAKASDAILFGAVGDWKYDKLDALCARNKPFWACAKTWACLPTSARPFVTKNWWRLPASSPS